ncbi:MAG: hypothetical protein ACFFDF_07995 [Candidatus Odinarchaeota archaeon]
MVSNSEKNELQLEFPYLSPIQYNLLKTLSEIGSSTRRDLVKKLQTPRTTIYDNLVKLQKRKLVEKFSRSNGKRGAPLVFWKLKKGINFRLMLICGMELDLKEDKIEPE